MIFFLLWLYIHPLFTFYSSPHGKGNIVYMSKKTLLEFRLTDRSTFGNFFFGGSQHVKYASQDQSQRARPWLIVICNFTGIDYNYLLGEHDGKLNFPPTLITLSWLPWDTLSVVVMMN